MFCIRCGIELSDDSKFCSKCGIPTVNNFTQKCEPPKVEQSSGKFSSVKKHFNPAALLLIVPIAFLTIFFGSFIYNELKYKNSQQNNQIDKSLGGSSGDSKAAPASPQSPRTSLPVSSPVSAQTPTVLEGMWMAENTPGLQRLLGISELGSDVTFMAWVFQGNRCIQRTFRWEGTRPVIAGPSYLDSFLTKQNGMLRIDAVNSIFYVMDPFGDGIPFRFIVDTVSTIRPGVTITRLQTKATDGIRRAYYLYSDEIGSYCQSSAAPTSPPSASKVVPKESGSSDADYYKGTTH